MQPIGFFRRLNEAMSNSESVKLIFQYPAMDRAVIKSGKVLEVDSRCFTVDEIKDGVSVYSYDFLVEVTGVKGGIYKNDKSKHL